MYNGSTGGLSFKSLLCFIPGIDKRKIWNPNVELRNLVKSLPKDEVHRIHLSRKNTQFYGSYSSDEDEDNDENSVLKQSYGDSEDDSCPPPYLLLPPRAEEPDSPKEITSNGKLPTPPTPEIVILQPSDSEKSLSDSGLGRNVSETLGRDDSLDNISEDSADPSTTSLMSPQTERFSQESDLTQPYATGTSDATTYTCSCGRSDTQYNSSELSSLSHSVSCSTCISTSTSCSSHEACRARQQYSGCCDRLSQTCEVTQQHLTDSNFNSIKYESGNESETSSLLEKCIKRTDANEQLDKFAKTSRALEQHLGTRNNVEVLPNHVDVISKHVVASEDSTDVPNMTFKLDADDLSSSADSRCFSYVSAPQRHPQVTVLQTSERPNSMYSEFTNWSSDSETVGALAGLISKDVSTHSLADGTASTAGDDADEIVNTDNLHSNVGKELSGDTELDAAGKTNIFTGFVQALLGKVPNKEPKSPTLEPVVTETNDGLEVSQIFCD